MARKENIGTLIAILMMMLVVYSRASTVDSRHHLTILAPQLPASKVLLRQCVNGHFVDVDSAYTTNRGVAEMTYGDLAKGIYHIRVDSHEYDFLLGDERGDLILQIDTSYRQAFKKVKGLRETRLFNSHKQYLQTCKEKRQKVGWKQQKKLDEKVKEHHSRLIADNKGTYLSDFVRMTLLFTQYGSVDALDSLTLTDRSLWNNLYLPYKIKRYLNDCCADNTTRFIAASEHLLDKVRNDTTTYYNMLEQLFSVAASTPYVEGENMRAYLTDKYLQRYDTLFDAWYTSFWEEYESNRYCKLGQKAYNLVLCDSIYGIAADLYSLDAPAVLLFFYDTDCEHCRHALPEYLELYRKYHEKGLEVVAVYIGFEEDKWLQFIETFQCEEWINVFAARDNPLFWRYYDVTHTPALYLLNARREIVAKKCDLLSLKKMIKQYISM